MNIVSIAPYLPYPGVPHAGGEYYRRHLELAAREHDVLVVCPRTPDNEAALASVADTPFRRLLVRPRLRTGVPGARAAYWFLSRAMPFLATGPLRRALLDDPAVLAELRRADRIELQWFDALVLAPPIRRAVPGTPLIGVFHDVVSQGLARTVRHGRVAVVRRVQALLLWLLAVPLEHRVLRLLDVAVVLSDKDRDLLHRRGRAGRDVVVSPPLEESGMPSSPRTERQEVPDVLFVGAMRRPENVDAALWLIEEIWPGVRAEVPDARLTIAGAEPTPAVQAAAAAASGVELTGYVDSLAPYYRRATVAVAPLRLGAGVKLKTAAAMLWGLPVVATSVAAEGVADPDLFLAVEDDAAALGRALVVALRDPSAGKDARERAFRWSHGRYSSEAYARSLEEVYA